MTRLTEKPNWGTPFSSFNGVRLTLTEPFQTFFDAIQQRLNDFLLGDAVILRNYTVATVPDATNYTSGAIIVTDEVGGVTIAISDGTNWRRVADGAVIS